MTDKDVQVNSFKKKKQSFASKLLVRYFWAMRRTIREIAQFLGKESVNKKEIFHFAFDSRKVKPGTFFFALKGEKVDGHTFLEEVASKGGLGAVVSKDYQGPHFGMELFPVENVRKALQHLARDLFKQRPPLVIGVTGTVGKTTTKEFIAGILSEKFRVSKSIGSENSQVSLPLTILNWEGEDEILVLEMGMSQKKELAQLVQMAPPDLGVLTKVSLAHAAFFDDLEDIAKAKCELFESKKLKHAFINREASEFKAVQKVKGPITWFEKATIQSPFTEAPFLENLGAAVSIARHLGMSDGEIEKGAQKLRPFTHRGEKVQKKGVLFIDDAYNASPIAMKGALKSLPEGRRRIGFLGAMKELGIYEEESHKEVGEYALPLLDELLCLGKECQVMVDLFQKKGKRATLFETKKEATAHLKKIMKEGDVVLLKGSNSFQLWTVLEEID
jgi:UDP-N-acetylmuramoyl-tripeptide--D-alanyl-D-alanine ligase